jgi:hypothetical protein
MSKYDNAKKTLKPLCNKGLHHLSGADIAPEACVLRQAQNARHVGFYNVFLPNLNIVLNIKTSYFFLTQFFDVIKYVIKK